MDRCIQRTAIPPTQLKETLTPSTQRVRADQFNPELCTTPAQDGEAVGEALHNTRRTDNLYRHRTWRTPTEIEGRIDARSSRLEELLGSDSAPISETEPDARAIGKSGTRDGQGHRPHISTLRRSDLLYLEGDCLGA